MKILYLLSLLCAASLLHAEISLVTVPDAANWRKSSAAHTRQIGKSLVLQQGTLSSPGVFSAGYKDCITVTTLYTGKGKIQFFLQELDRNRSEIRRHFKDIVNPRPETHSRSVSFDITSPNTRFFTLGVKAENNPGLGIISVVCRRMTAEDAELYSAERNRALWKKRISGTNLSSGLTAEFDPQPNYALTRVGKSDHKDLTDGKISTRYNEYIWFDPLAVGWSTNANVCQIKFDLKAVKNISKAVIRICGGRREAYHGHGMFPTILETWISRDGKNWYRSAALKKVNINEKADADWKSLYYLPEFSESNSPPYMYPFELNINASARYVVLRLSKNNPILYLDEAVLVGGSEKNPGFNRVYSSEPDTVLFSKDAAITPFYPEIYIPRGKINLPNWFKFDDRREQKEAGLSYFIDLPQEVIHTPETTYPRFLRNLIKTENKNARTIRYYHCNYKDAAVMKEAARCKIGPFFFRTEKNIPEKERYVRIGTTTGKKHKKQVIRQYKLNIIDIPEVPRQQYLDLTFPWFSQRETFYWPGYIKMLHHIGATGTGWHTGKPEKGSQFFAEAKKHGIKIIAVPIRPPVQVLGPNSRLYKCTGGGNRICPSLRGPLYEKFCASFVESLKGIPADMIHLDDELWSYPGNFTRCSRCQALRKNKKMDWSEFAEWVMADFYAGVLKSIRKARPGVKIGSYMYCLDRSNTVYGKSFPISGTAKLFPALLDEVQTPYYGPNPEQVKRRVRNNFLKAGDPAKVTVYLTGGSGAYYTDQMGEKTMWQLLEAYMNGAGTIAYYITRSFTSPVDFMYIARGMKVIQPYGKFLQKSGIDDKFSGSNRNLCYTIRKQGKKALCLVGNYNSGKSEKTFLPLPGIRSAKDCFSNKKIDFSPTGITLNIPAGRGSLIAVEFY